MLWLVLSLAFANEPTEPLERPSRAPDAAGDCSGVEALDAGESRDCVSVGVPPASWAAALQWRAYADALEREVAVVHAERDEAVAAAARRDDDVARLRVDLEAARRRANAARLEGAALTVAAVALGVGVTLGAAYAVDRVSQ